MKKFPFHRRIVLVLGIGVALAIAIAMWTAQFSAHPTGEIERPTSLTPQFTDLVRQSAASVYRAAEIMVTASAVGEN